MAEPPNQDEWRRWIADHAPKLLLFARQMARSEADAQDLVQENAGGMLATKRPSHSATPVALCHDPEAGN